MIMIMVKQILIWKVWGSTLTPLYIIGNSMDEVLKQARKVNCNYNTVQLYRKEKLIHKIQKGEIN